MPHILVVCSANICRSPVVVGLLRQQVETAQLSGWTVSSAGTWAEHGHKASSDSVDLLAKRGMDISSHRSQPITEEIVSGSDLVLCMEGKHVVDLKTKFSSHEGRVFLISEMVGKTDDVADPFGQSQDKYTLMIDEVSELTASGWSRIFSLATRNAVAREGK